MRFTPVSSARWTRWSSWAFTTPTPRGRRPWPPSGAAGLFESPVGPLAGRGRRRRGGDHVGPPSGGGGGAGRRLSRAGREAAHADAAPRRTISIARAAAAGRRLSVGHVERFNPGIRACREPSRGSAVHHLPAPRPVPAAGHRRAGDARPDDPRHRPGARAWSTARWQAWRPSGYR